MKRSLRSHEAKRVVVIHVPKTRFIGRSPASFFMHCRCASFPKQKALLTKCFLLWRHHPESNWGIKVLQTSALPLGYGAIWSGKRGSNPPPLPWQGSALPNELFPQYGASEWSRTTDTGIFSPLLYQLSYRGKNLATRRGLEPLTFSVTG